MRQVKNKRSQENVTLKREPSTPNAPNAPNAKEDAPRKNIYNIFIYANNRQNKGFKCIF